MGCKSREYRKGVILIAVGEGVVVVIEGLIIEGVVVVVVIVTKTVLAVVIIKMRSLK